MIALMIMASLIVYLLIAVYMTWKVAGRFKSKASKWGTAIVSVLVFVLIPTWDEIAGRIYFKHLCETEGGIKVWKTVELGPEFFLVPGEIDMNTAGRLPARGGELNHPRLKAHFSETTESKQISGLFHIERDTRVIKDPQTQDLIGSETHFLYFRGWLINSTGLHVSGESCPAGTTEYFNKFYGSVFKRKQPNN